MGTKSDKVFNKSKDLFGENQRSTRLKPLNPKEQKNWRAKYDDEDIDDDDDDFEDDDDFVEDEIEEVEKDDDDFNLDEDLSDPAFEDDDDDDDEFFDDSAF